MNKSVYQTLKEIGEIPNIPQRVYALQQVPAVSVLLGACWHPDARWLLPDSDPPYEPLTETDVDNHFWRKIRELYLFLEGGNPGIKPFRREQLFINMLESIHPDDAKLLLDAKNKKINIKGITSSIILEAFPGLFPAPPKRGRKPKEKSNGQ